MEIEIKSNSIEVAFNVFVTPSAFSKSESVPQEVEPSFNKSVFKVLPASLAFPVVKTKPFSKGKLEELRWKEPKLFMLSTLPLI